MDTTKPTFLTLPRELRDKVYDFALGGNLIKSSDLHSRRVIHNCPAWNIRMVCHQIQEEYVSRSFTLRRLELLGPYFDSYNFVSLPDTNKDFRHLEINVGMYCGPGNAIRSKMPHCCAAVWQMALFRAGLNRITSKMPLYVYEYSDAGRLLSMWYDKSKVKRVYVLGKDRKLERTGDVENYPGETGSEISEREAAEWHQDDEFFTPKCCLMQLGSLTG